MTPSFALTLLFAQGSAAPDAMLFGLVATGGLVLLVLLIGVWRLLRARRAKRAAARPSTCGQCGYDVAGLPTFTCPECGADLRQVGIVRGRKAGAASIHTRIGPLNEALRLMGVLALWTVLYAALYACFGTGSYPRHPWDSLNRPTAYGLVDAYLWPYQGKSTHAVTLEPSSGAYRRVTVSEHREARFQGWRNAPDARWTGDSPNVGLTKFEIAVQVDLLDGRAATIDVNPSDMSWRAADPQNPGKTLSGKPLDGQVMWGWMLQNGVDMPSPTVKEEADMLVAIIGTSVRSGTIGGTTGWATGRLERIVARQRDAVVPGMAEYPFKTSRGTANDVYGPAWSIYWLSIPFGLGVYSYGTNWIWNRYRKRTAVTGAAPSNNLAAQTAATAAAAALGAAGGSAVAGTSPAPEAERRRRSRTLTILFTDLKDYTRRTASASRDALRAMLAKNREIVEGAVSATDGSVVKTIGDAFLITFDSATDAVLAGLEIQRAAARYNAAVGDGDGRLEYRIAVSTGEVTLEHGDVFGTPVNVAARVQALAEPGSVLITESTLHAINPAEVEVTEVGPRELKGIATPVRVYEARAIGG